MASTRGEKNMSTLGQDHKDDQWDDISRMLGAEQEELQARELALREREAGLEQWASYLRREQSALEQQREQFRLSELTTERVFAELNSAAARLDSDWQALSDWRRRHAHASNPTSDDLRVQREMLQEQEKQARQRQREVARRWQELEQRQSRLAREEQQLLHERRGVDAARKACAAEKERLDDLGRQLRRERAQLRRAQSKAKAENTALRATTDAWVEEARAKVRDCEIKLRDLDASRALRQRELEAIMDRLKVRQAQVRVLESEYLRRQADLGRSEPTSTRLTLDASGMPPNPRSPDAGPKTEPDFELLAEPAPDSITPSHEAREAYCQKREAALLEQESQLESIAKVLEALYEQAEGLARDLEDGAARLQEARGWQNTEHPEKFDEDAPARVILPFPTLAAEDTPREHPLAAYEQLRQELQHRQQRYEAEFRRQQLEMRSERARLHTEWEELGRVRLVAQQTHRREQSAMDVERGKIQEQLANLRHQQQLLELNSAGFLEEHHRAQSERQLLEKLKTELRGLLASPATVMAPRGLEKLLAEIRILLTLEPETPYKRLEAERQQVERLRIHSQSQAEQLQTERQGRHELLDIVGQLQADLEAQKRLRLSLQRHQKQQHGLWEIERQRLVQRIEDLEGDVDHLAAALIMPSDETRVQAA